MKGPSSKTTVNNSNQNSNTAISAKDTDLHRAAKNGHAETVSLLLDNGADINAKNRDGQTALHVAAKYGHDAIVSLLLDNGADIEAKNIDGSTPLHRAAKKWSHCNSFTSFRQRS